MPFSRHKMALKMLARPEQPSVWPTFGFTLPIYRGPRPAAARAPPMVEARALSSIGSYLDMLVLK